MAEPNEAPTSNCDPRLEEPRRALARNWALIPLKGKIPQLKRWQKSEPANLATVYGWLRKGRNLGLRTGAVSGVVVIDDDSPDGSASAALNLPKTVTVITGSGKKHFYFRAPSDFPVSNSVKSVADGIDVRGDGGQVVYVGSIHPTTQQPYTWAPGLSPEEVELADLPPHIIEKLRPQKKERKPKLEMVDLRIVRGDEPPDDVVQEECPSRIASYVEHAFADEIAIVHGSTEGHRNDTLNKSAFALGTLVGAGVLDRERARAALHSAALAAGLGDSEAESTIDSGMSAGEKEPRDLSSLQSPAEQDGGPGDAGGQAEDSRPQITLFAGWLHRAVTKAERILLIQQPPIIYQRGSSLVRIAMIPQAGSGRTLVRKPMIQEVTPIVLVDRLTELIHWQKMDKDGVAFAVDCTDRVAQMLLSRSGTWKLPPLTGVIDAPTLRADGGILAKDGYDRTSGLYVALGGQHWPPVPLHPTPDAIKSALGSLQDILKGFPFLMDADRSVALGAILTALIRPSLRTAPLFAFRAAKMGSGKSLLADVVAMVAAGRPAAVMSQGADENEDKKRMLPILAEGDPVAVIDNIERPFGSAALCSILTQTSWRDRVLGKSQTLSLPTTNTVWIATGNNIVFEGDITTRVLVCDLDPGCEHPETRKFDVNLHQHIPLHRGELVAAGLTILRAYHVAGRPDMNLAVFGRFEEWSNWVRSAIVWLGLPDPCETRRRVEETDPVRAQLTTLLAALQEQFVNAPFQVADVLTATANNTRLRAAVESVLASAGPGRGQAQALGMFFQKVDRRPEGGIRLVRGATRGGSASWRIEDV